MEILRIEILNPKARKILEQLADMKLISIRKSKDSEAALDKILKDIRSKSYEAPDYDEIRTAVENVRTERYAQKKKN